MKRMTIKQYQNGYSIEKWNKAEPLPYKTVASIKDIKREVEEFFEEEE